MRYAMAFAAIFLAVIGLILWAASEGHLDCPEGQNREIVSYITTTTTGKPPVTTTTPIYACK